jgi:Helix-turn-helix domain
MTNTVNGVNFFSMKSKVEKTPEAATGPKLAATPVNGSGIIDAEEMLRRLPVSRGTLLNWRKAGKIPAIEIGGRVLFDWPSVQAALLRLQRGSAE